jgi:hypothetical protein
MRLPLRDGFIAEAISLTVAGIAHNTSFSFTPQPRFFLGSWELCWYNLRR